MIQFNLDRIQCSVRISSRDIITFLFSLYRCRLFFAVSNLSAVRNKIGNLCVT